jgi:Zn-dependent protease with chaperone function
MSPRQLAVVAVAAQGLHQLFLLLPWALFCGFAAAWYGWHPLYTTLSAVTFLLLAWLMQPEERAELKLLAREQAPDLHAEVDRLADAMQAPRVHAIALDDTFNAGALEQNRGISLRPTRRVLILGRPLLAALDREAVLAIIAHELGHFSRQHGRLGHWLYRTRAAWEGWQQHVDAERSSAWERAAGAFASVFVPWFKRASLADSRRCEYEADATAARACGALALARALVLLEAGGQAMEVADEAAMLRLLHEHAQPPVDLLARRVAAWRGLPALDLPVAADLDATHPPNAQRLAALGVAEQAWAVPHASALAAWALSDETLDRADLVEWAMWHALLRALDAGGDLPALQRAAWLGNCTEVLRLGETRAADATSELLRARALFAVGRLAQARDLWMQLAGIDAPRSCVRDAACRDLAERGVCLGLDETGRSPYEQRRQGIQQRRGGALDKIEQGFEQGRAPVTRAWPEALRAALTAGLSQHPAVREAWLGEAAAEMAGDWRYTGVLLWIRIDPVAMQAEGQQQDQVIDACAALLRHCAPPGAPCRVRARYTTEGLPPALESGGAPLRLF